jgi:hypothetical protein
MDEITGLLQMGLPSTTVVGAMLTARFFTDASLGSSMAEE